MHDQVYSSDNGLRLSVQHISAHMNPAYCLGLWLIGDLDAADFFALSAAELGGAIIGVLTFPSFPARECNTCSFDTSVTQAGDAYVTLAARLSHTLALKGVHPDVYVCLTHIYAEQGLPHRSVYLHAQVLAWFGSSTCPTLRPCPSLLPSTQKTSCCAAEMPFRRALSSESFETFHS